MDQSWAEFGITDWLFDPIHDPPKFRHWDIGSGWVLGHGPKWIDFVGQVRNYSIVDLKFESSNFISHTIIFLFICNF